MANQPTNMFPSLSLQPSSMPMLPSLSPIPAPSSFPSLVDPTTSQAPSSFPSVSPTQLPSKPATGKINATLVHTIQTSYTDYEVCPHLVNRTYLDIYNNDTVMQGDGGACSCRKRHRNYEVYCGFYYCSECYQGICVGKVETYYYSTIPKGNSTTMIESVSAKDKKTNKGSISIRSQTEEDITNLSHLEVQAFEQEFVFLTEEIPFVTRDPQNNQIIDEGNWTSVRIQANETSCFVFGVDDLDEEEALCTCNEVTCGNTTRFSYDCQGKQWGNCNSTLDNFDPDELDVDNPLFVLNPNYLPWSECFENKNNTHWYGYT